MTFVEFAAHSAPGIDSLSVGAVRTRIGAEPTCLNFASSAQYQARHKIANFHEDFIQATSSCKRRAAILRIALLTGRDWDDAGRSPGHPILFDLNFRSAHSQTEHRLLLRGQASTRDVHIAPGLQPIANPGYKRATKYGLAPTFRTDLEFYPEAHESTWPRA